MRAAAALATFGVALAGQLHHQLRRPDVLPVDSAPEEIECLRKALVKTEDTMKEAQLATASHDAANRLMQNLVVVAMRQVQALTDTASQLTPELAACLQEKRPEVNQTGNHTLNAVAADTVGNFSTHALRAEMHNIRVFDTHAAQLEHDIEDCKACGDTPTTLDGVALLRRKQMLRRADQQSGKRRLDTKGGKRRLLPAASPLLPLITSELEQVQHQFVELKNAARAAKASSAVMEGMTAEATKAAFRLQEDVAELHARLASCGRESAPFIFHDEVDMHLGDNPEVAKVMYARAKDEAASRSTEVADLTAELAACKADCEMKRKFAILKATAPQ